MTPFSQTKAAKGLCSNKLLFKTLPSDFQTKLDFIALNLVNKNVNPYYHILCDTRN